MRLSIGHHYQISPLGLRLETTFNNGNIVISKYMDNYRDVNLSISGNIDDANVAFERVIYDLKYLNFYYDDDSDTPHDVTTIIDIRHPMRALLIKCAKDRHFRISFGNYEDIRQNTHYVVDTLSRIYQSYRTGVNMNE